jgi:hypothetical protein
MNKDDMKFLMGVLASFLMKTSSITQARMAKAVLTKLNEEIKK